MMSTNIEDIPFIRPFDNAKEVRAGFFSAQGGISEGIYQSLNCGLGSEDLPENVIENRARVAKSLGMMPERLLSLYQTHSANCLHVEKSWRANERPRADGMVTQVPDIGLSILTADCAPVLLYGYKEDGSPVIGAAHAGWRGALDGILLNTVREMENRGAELTSIKAAIGPCISQSSYEVDESFYKRFMDKEDAFEQFFKSGAKPGHYHFDLPGACAFLLSQAGVTDIKLCDEDTYTQNNKYFSYRRATHQGESDYGRQLSVIIIKPVEV